MQEQALIDISEALEESGAGPDAWVVVGPTVMEPTSADLCTTLLSHVLQEQVAFAVSDCVSVGEIWLAHPASNTLKVFSIKVENVYK